jgi:suppressor for copper-sensitivity B
MCRCSASFSLLHRTVFSLAAVLWFCGFAAAEPGASPWAETDHTAVRLVSATHTVGEGKRVVAGLHFRLREGWKVYWRSPGDAGFPPRADWSGSRNLTEASVSWPAPLRFSILGLQTLGYKDEVVLPITVTLTEAGRPLSLRASVDYLTCKEICIPYTARLALDLPAGLAGTSRFAHLINRFAVRVPGDGAAHGLAIDSAGVTGTKAAPVLRVAASARDPFEKPDLYVEGPVELVFAPPRVQLTEGGRRAVLEVTVAGMEYWKGVLVGTPLTFTLVDGERNAERAVTMAAAAADTANPGTSLMVILGLALIGGLILNLMPCVLPVLSIKLLGVIGHGGGEARSVRTGFIATAAGILFSFLALAGGLLALKAGGAWVGWGIQFQHPGFLVAMTLVVTLFACNLWGFFEVALPEWAGDLGGRAGGHFLTGAFATLLATPCTAPFVGTAVGFAFSRGAGEILAVFAALGVGLALPYLMVAAVPSLATRLPRPGPWMVVLRRILGFALAATAIWLLTVLTRQTGATAAAVVAALMAAVVAVTWLRRRFGRATGVLVAALGVAALVVPAGLSGTVTTKAGAKAFWQPFDQAAIPGLIADGRVVLVDVTADWCITCQVNKTLVLHRGAVLSRLEGDGVVAMQADWTNPDDTIARYLSAFGRYGIPFDAVYGPGAPNGIVLPELLTEAAVLSALDRAR